MNCRVALNLSTFLWVLIFQIFAGFFNDPQKKGFLRNVLHCRNYTQTSPFTNNISFFKKMPVITDSSCDNGATLPYLYLCKAVRLLNYNCKKHTTPPLRYDQYLTNAHNHIILELVAVDSCFVQVGTHQHGIARQGLTGACLSLLYYLKIGRRKRQKR